MSDIITDASEGFNRFRNNCKKLEILSAQPIVNQNILLIFDI